MIILKSKIDNFIKIFYKANSENEPLIFPTDTIYGIGSFFDNKISNEKIYKLKNREKTKPFPVIISDFAQLKMLEVLLTGSQKEVLKKYWPNNFTFILNTSLNLNYCVLNSKIAVRMVKDIPLALTIEHFNKPVTATSANLSNKEYSSSIEEIVLTFWDKIKYFLISADVSNKPSTIVDLTVRPYKFLRNPHNLTNL